jgi:hypothetical protein
LTDPFQLKVFFPVRVDSLCPGVMIYTQPTHAAVFVGGLSVSPKVDMMVFKIERSLTEKTLLFGLDD